MSTFWTDEDRKEAKRLGVNIMFRNTTIQAVKDQDKELPTDVHVIKYEMDGEVFYDAVRAGKRVDIFDLYYDRLKTLNGRVLHISIGYGTIKPKLWGYTQPGDSK